jgi:hypothetical protein
VADSSSVKGAPPVETSSLNQKKKKRKKSIISTFPGLMASQVLPSAKPGILPTPADIYSPFTSPLPSPSPTPLIPGPGMLPSSPRAHLLLRSLRAMGFHSLPLMSHLRPLLPLLFLFLMLLDLRPRPCTFQNSLLSYAPFCFSGDPSSCPLCPGQNCF